MKPIFIYARHTPKQMRIFASEQISPSGQKLSILDDRHPMFNRTVQIIHQIDDHMQNRHFGRRVSLAQLAKEVTPVTATLVHLPGHKTAPERILIRFETSH